MESKGRATRIEARESERDEWIVAVWQVWPGKRWEAVEILARVPTPNGDPQAIKRAKAIAEFLRG